MNESYSAPRRLADYAELAERVRAMRDGMLKLSVTADSDDGLIHAVVDGSGHLTELELDPRIFRTPDAAGLAKEILTTVRTAIEDSRQQAAEIAKPVVPDANPKTFLPSVDPVLRLVDRELRK